MLSPPTRCPKCQTELAVQGLAMAERIVCVKCFCEMTPDDLGICSVVVRQASTGSAVGTLQSIAVPIGRNGWAIAAGYLGLFAALPFFGLLAILTGYFGLKSITKKKPRGKFRSWFGILSGILFTALYLFLAMMIAARFPYLLIIYVLLAVATIFAAIWLARKRKKAK